MNVQNSQLPPYWQNQQTYGNHSPQYYQYDYDEEDFRDDFFNQESINTCCSSHGSCNNETRFPETNFNPNMAQMPLPMGNPFQMGEFPQEMMPSQGTAGWNYGMMPGFQNMMPHNHMSPDFQNMMPHNHMSPGFQNMMPHNHMSPGFQNMIPHNHMMGGFPSMIPQGGYPGMMPSGTMMGGQGGMLMPTQHPYHFSPFSNIQPGV